MKKILIAIAALMLCVQGFAQKQKYVVGFYNLENLFDIYDDPAKNDEQYLPDGQNNWTAEKYAKKVKNMAQQILQFNQAQLQLLDMMSFVKTPEALSDLNKAISDYFVKKADEEMEKMWDEGTLDNDKIEGFRTLHERTPYNKPSL